MAVGPNELSQLQVHESGNIGVSSSWRMSYGYLGMGYGLARELEETGYRRNGEWRLSRTTVEAG